MSRNNICSALMRREMTGKFAHHHNRLAKNKPELPFPSNSNSSVASQCQFPLQDKVKNSEILNLRMSIDLAIPKIALQSGHIVMGFTHCNRFLMTYTIRPAIPQHAQNSQNRIPEEFDSDSLFTYKLYFWLFVPYRMSKKYASVFLFDRNGIADSNLIIQISQWKFSQFNNDKLIVVTGRSSNPEDNPRCFLTLTQIPRVSASFICQRCKCTPNSTDPNERIMNRCPSHSLTLSLTYELVSPFPQFDPEVCLYLTEEATPTLLINTGNMFHQVQFNPCQTQTRSKSNLLKADINTNLPHYLHYYHNRLLPTQAKECRRFFKRDLRRQNPPGESNANILKKPDVYDLFNEDDKIDKNYRLYRNRQLADKKYEFVDEYVLRPLHSSNKRIVGGDNSVQQQKSKTVYIKKSIAKVTRSYVLTCDECESVSTTTEIEDNDYNFTEYPIALPTCIFTDQSQLSMIPNYKAVDKKIVVTQTSLDIEILSNEIASIICTKENMHFVFLIDFDSVVLQTHPQNGSITALVILLIQASKEQENNNNRLKYETSYILEWHPLTQSAKILFKGKLKIANQIPSSDHQVWNPTRKFGAAARIYRQGNPHLNNHQMVYDWISIDELKDWDGILTLFREGVSQTIEDDEDEDDYYNDDVFSLLSISTDED